MRVYHYLTDFFGSVPEDRAADVLRLVAATRNFLGVSPAQSKCAFGSCVEALGFLFDTPSSTVWIPQDKLNDIRADVREMLKGDRPHTTPAAIASLAGRLINTSRVCTPGRAFVCGLWDWLRDHSDLSRHTETPVGRDMTGDMRWWRCTLKEWPRSRLLRADHAVVHM